MPRQRLNAIALSDCRICDEVTALHAYGWDTRTILAALQRSAESVLRHLRQYDHPHADLFVPLASDSAREREHRRKASA